MSPRPRGSFLPIYLKWNASQEPMLFAADVGDAQVATSPDRCLGSVQSSTVKETIYTLGFATEFFAKVLMRGHVTKERPFVSHTRSLVERGIITDEQKTELDWVGGVARKNTSTHCPG